MKESRNCSASLRAWGLILLDSNFFRKFTKYKREPKSLQYGSRLLTLTQKTNIDYCSGQDGNSGSVGLNVPVNQVGATVAVQGVISGTIDISKVTDPKILNEDYQQGLRVWNKDMTVDPTATRVVLDDSSDPKAKVPIQGDSTTIPSFKQLIGSTH